MARFISYWDLYIPSADQDFIDRLIDEYDVNCDELEITYAFEKEEFSTYSYTNAIIHEILKWIILDRVEDQDDIFDLEESIYTNCLDSWFDIDPDKLRSKEAKELVRNF